MFWECGSLFILRNEGLPPLQAEACPPWRACVTEAGHSRIPAATRRFASYTQLRELLLQRR